MKIAISKISNVAYDGLVFLFHFVDKGFGFNSQFCHQYFLLPAVYKKKK